MGLTVKLLLALMLVSLGQCRVLKHERLLRDHDQIQTLPELPEIPQEHIYIDSDDKSKDPDWVPSPEDYEVDPADLYYEDLIDQAFAEGLDNSESAEENESPEEDKTWLHYDDPDWVPSADPYDSGYWLPSADSHSQETVSDEHDPDWVPSSQETVSNEDDPDWLPTSDEYYYDDDYYLYDDDDYYYEDDDHTISESTAELVKGKRQVKGGYSQQQSGQIQQSSQVQQSQQTGQIQQSSQVQQSGHYYGTDDSHYSQTLGADLISIGIEPYDEKSQVTAGVEAVDQVKSSEEDGSSFFGWIGDSWDKVVDTAEKAKDHIEDRTDEWGNHISGAVDTISDAVSSAVDVVVDKAQSAGETIVGLYHEVKGKIPELQQRIRVLFSKFGLVVQHGVEYCILRIGETADQVRQAEIIDKLQQKLQEGNQEVKTFFVLLGQKITRWSQEHGHQDVDDGLDYYAEIQQQGQNLPEGGSDGQQRQTVPNFFQDQDVSQQLDVIQQSGWITQEDLNILTQQQRYGRMIVEEQQQNSQQSQSSGVIQEVVPSKKKRAFRLLRKTLKKH